MPHKLVIRRLPPTLPEDTFWNVVQPWVNDKTCLWRRFVKGDFSRAYVLMVDPQSVVSFHRDFDGHIFKRGTEQYQAIVEFAPYQRSPYKAKAKTDARQGTIEDDPDFKSFSTSGPPERPVAIASTATPQPTTTPLLEHLRAKKKAKEAAKKDSTKEAALASVNKAAAKRLPKDAKEKLVAGKGREVTVQGEGKKKPRKKKPKEPTDKAPAGLAKPTASRANSDVPKPQKKGKGKAEAVA